MSSRGEHTAINRLSISAMSVDLFCCFVFFFSAKTFRESTQLRGFLCTLFLLTCLPSSSGPEVLIVSFQGQFDVKS